MNYNCIIDQILSNIPFKTQYINKKKLSPRQDSEQFEENNSKQIKCKVSK